MQYVGEQKWPPDRPARPHALDRRCGGHFCSPGDLDDGVLDACPRSAHAPEGLAGWPAEVHVRRCLLCVLAAVLSLVAVVGCSTREPTAPAAAPSPDPRLATWPGDPDDGPARLMAANAGVLDLVDGCVVLRNGSAPTTLLLPAAVSAFDGSAVTIRGRSYPLGTPVLMGGGSYDADVQARVRTIWSVPKSCPATEWWATGDLEQGIQTQPRKGEYEPWGFAAVWDSSRKPTPADALTLKTSLIVIPHRARR
jgi:hypothetical protein